MDWISFLSARLGMSTGAPPALASVRVYQWDRLVETSLNSAPLAAFMVEVRISGGRLMAGLRGNVP